MKSGQIQKICSRLRRNHSVTLKRVQRSFIVSSSPLVSRCTAVLMHVSPKINASTQPAVVHRLLACLPPLSLLTSTVSLLRIFHHHRRMHLSHALVHSLSLLSVSSLSSILLLCFIPFVLHLLSLSSPIPRPLPSSFLSHTPAPATQTLPKPDRQSISSLVKIWKHRLLTPFPLAQPGTAFTFLPSQFESSEAVTSWMFQRPNLYDVVSRQ